MNASKAGDLGTRGVASRATGNSCLVAREDAATGQWVVVSDRATFVLEAHTFTIEQLDAPPLAHFTYAATLCARVESRRACENCTSPISTLCVRPQLAIQVAS
jgi:hypothetical protein